MKRIYRTDIKPQEWVPHEYLLEDSADADNLPTERPPAVIANTGNGGAGGKYATMGASGIVVMRNTRGDS